MKWLIILLKVIIKESEAIRRHHGLGKREILREIRVIKCNDERKWNNFKEISLCRRKKYERALKKKKAQSDNSKSVKMVAMVSKMAAVQWRCCYFRLTYSF